MLKTIKTTKQLRLDELIKYVWENSVNEKRVFLGNHGQRVVFDNVGGFYPSGYPYSPYTTFSVEIEEEITEDTEFENLIAVERDGNSYYEYKKSVGFILSKKSNLIQILAFVDGKYITIWERE